MNRVIDPEALGERAWFFLNRLVKEIGPRPAGQEGETRARELVRGQAQAWGYQGVDMPFDFPPQPRFFPYYSLLAVGFLLAAGLLPRLPWLCLLLPLLVAALPVISDFLQANLARAARTANLLLLPPGAREEKVDLVFCAHLDSARAAPQTPRFLQRMSAQIDAAAQRLAWILAALAFLPLFGLRLPALAHWVVMAVGLVYSVFLVGMDLWQQLGERGATTVGANDNASGVGVLLALAEFLAGQHPEALKIGFLFTAAEEAGLYGAQAYASRLQGLGIKPFLVNVDMIGAGEGLRLILQSGSLIPRRTDATLNGWLQRAEPEIQPWVYHRRSGDFAAFVRKGLPAAGIEGKGSPAFWQAYHTLADRPALIDRAMLARTASALARLVFLLERDRGGRKLP
jgi:hypothetical protein